MDIREASNILGVSKEQSIDEIKAKYKMLVKEWHPDTNKSAEASEKIKSINAAFQFIKDYKENPNKFNQNPFKRADWGDNVIFEDFNINDFFTHSTAQTKKRKNFKYKNPISLTANISFKESILGTDKEVKYSKYIKCIDCDGNGNIAISNNCKSCNGFGKITQSSNNMTFTKICDKCFGRNIKTKNCNKCSNLGVHQVETNGKIRVPPGTNNKSFLRLKNAGHYIGVSILGSEAYTEVIVQIIVEKDNSLQLINNNVISYLNISLLEAISGCNKDIKTIFDNRDITIPPLSKNKDEVILPDCGVKPNGVQKIILNVDYPENIEELKTFLGNKCHLQ